MASYERSRHSPPFHVQHNNHFPASFNLKKSKRRGWTRPRKFRQLLLGRLTLAGSVTNLLSTEISLKMPERSEAKSLKRSFASNYLKFWFWREASLCALFFASLNNFFAKFKWTTNRSLFLQRLIKLRLSQAKYANSWLVLQTRKIRIRFSSLPEVAFSMLLLAALQKCPSSIL